MGFEAYQDRVNNAIGILGSGNKAIILLGHMDTVRAKFLSRSNKVNSMEEGPLIKGPLASFICAGASAEREIASGQTDCCDWGRGRGGSYLSRRPQAVADFSPPHF